MKLSDAILIGCDRRAQAFGDMFVKGDNGEIHSCALGAAYEASHSIGFRAWGRDSDLNLDEFRAQFPILAEVFNDVRFTVEATITILNDKHHLSREDIAIKLVKPVEEMKEAGLELFYPPGLPEPRRAGVW